MLDKVLPTTQKELLPRLSRGESLWKVEIHNVDFTNHRFDRFVNFSGAIFTGKANFSKAQFMNGADFTWATFSGDDGARFVGAHFSGTRDASFREATFSGRGGANFSGAEFTGEGGADFHGAKFYDQGGANFINATFSGKGGADFGEATFSGDDGVNFFKAIFSGEGGAIFSETEFSGKRGALFGGAEFSGKKGVLFSSAHFISDGGANFYGTQFSGEGWANFAAATFSGRGNANFGASKFYGREGAVFDRASFSCEGGVDFSRATFSGPGDFRFIDTRFDESCPVNFSSLRVDHPQKLRFEDVHLGRASFMWTDLEEITFKNVLFCEHLKGTPPRTIRDKVNSLKKILSVKRTCLIDEVWNDVVPEKEKRTYLVDHYHQIEILYRQLKHNFEAKRDYRNADDFHFGLMEMRLKQKPPMLRNCSLTAWYKLISGYGTQWQRAFLSFICVTILFSLLNLFWIKPAALAMHPAGLGEQASCVSEMSICPGVTWSDSFLYTFNTMTLRSDSHFLIKGELWWAGAMAALQSIVGPVILLLLILAVRRQFRS